MAAVSYLRSNIAESWDTIVIGSGMSGLTTASLLSKYKKKRVLVLERHYVEGGFMHKFKRPGYDWTPGVHYIGDVTNGSYIDCIFEAIGDGSLQWACMGDVYDTAVIGSEKYEFPKGRNNLVTAFKSWFPDEHQAIDKYFAYVAQAKDAFFDFQAHKALPRPIAKLSAPFMLKGFYKWSDKSLRQVLQPLTSNQRLIAVISAQYGDYGLPPAEVSFVVHAMVANHYFDGGYYPVGGSQNIAKSILPIIEAAGGMVVINAEVDQIVIKNNRAIGVRMSKDGRIIKAKNVVSSAGVNCTFSRLLAQDVIEHNGLDKKLKTVAPSLGHLCLYLGLNKTAEQLKLPKSNFWVLAGDNPEQHFAAFEKEYSRDVELPVYYFSFPGAKDPDFTKRHPGHSTVDIMINVPYKWFEKWAGTHWKKRGKDYDDFKQQFTHNILEKFYKLFPQTKGFVEIAELSTPLSTQHFGNYARGEAYGIMHTPERFRQSWLRSSTSIKNFYLTGQDISMVGVAGAMLGGVLTVSTMTRKNFTKVALREYELKRKNGDAIE